MKDINTSRQRELLLGLFREMLQDLYDHLRHVDGQAELKSLIPSHFFNRKWVNSQISKDMSSLEKAFDVYGITQTALYLKKIGERVDGYLAFTGVKNVSSDVTVANLHSHLARLPEIGNPAEGEADELFGFVREPIMHLARLVLYRLTSSFEMKLEENVRHLTVTHGLPDLHSYEQLAMYSLDPNQATDVVGCAAKLYRVLRSVLYCIYKVEVPATPLQIKEAIKAFLETEEDAGVRWSTKTQRVVDIARVVMGRCLQGFDFQGGIPFHGPGAVAGGERDEEKWNFTTLFTTLHSKFPYWDYHYGASENGRRVMLAANAAKYRELKKDSEPTSRLIAVPKDARGPRLICAEPLELMFVQQAVRVRLQRHIEWHCGLTRDHVNFEDQSINATLALSNAHPLGAFATLDLKDASDRVTQELVKSLVNEDQWQYLQALRSTHVQLPDGGPRIKTTKYAPMGSAMCFPIEALVFFSICVAAIADWSPVTGFIGVDAAIQKASDTVYVYGDDIIVPTEYARVCYEALELVGLKVNVDKSFYSGWFRESCGTDAWLCQDITPIKIKKLPGRGPKNPRYLEAWCMYSTRYNEVHMYNAARYCRAVVERELGHIVPATPTPASHLHVVWKFNSTPLRDYPNVRYNAKLQRIEAKLPSVRVPMRKSRLESWERLMADLTGQSGAGEGQLVAGRDTAQLVYTWHPLQADQTALTDFMLDLMSLIG